MLQHGVMAPDTPPRTFGNVVPGSGTGALAGLSGTVEITGGHTLTLTYEVV